jgi:hypothetical protein
MAQTKTAPAPRQVLWARREREKELLSALLLDRRMVCGCGHKDCDNGSGDLEERVTRAKRNISILTDQIIDG